MRRSLLILPAVVVGLAAAAFFALSADPNDALPIDPQANEEHAEARQGDIEFLQTSLAQERAAIDRLAIELGVPELAEDEAVDGSELVIRGRVVTAELNPIANAGVEVRVRRNVRAIFEDGPSGVPQGADWQSLFRQRRLGRTVLTDGNGVFTVSGRTFTRGAGVELAVTHADYAPRVETQDWQPEEGELRLPDIVLGVGAEVSGVVVGPTGAPVAEATVRLEPLADGGGGPGGPGGPGGRGGFGGGRGGRGRPDDGGLRALLPEVVTDPSGRFSFQHAPAGVIVVTATARRHVDGRTDRETIEDGARVDVGALLLGPGAELSGTVLDEHGGPVAGATVSVTVANGGNGGNNGGGRGRGGQGGNNNVDSSAGNGRGQRGGGNADPAAANGRGGADNGNPRQRGGQPQGIAAMFGGGRGNSNSTTDKDGQYLLDRVPAAELAVTVRHESFVDERVESVDVRIQTRLDIRMTHRPAIEGTVVDAATGEPVETFGIRWRRDNSNAFQRGFQMMGNRLQDNGGELDPERAAMMAQMQELAAQAEQQMRRAEAERRLRLGGSGQIAGSTPKPTIHAAGRFHLENVEPGTFLLDLDAPGYIKIAAGPFTVTTDTLPPEIQIRVERGGVTRGRVVAANNGEPVGGARITVSIPAPPGNANQGLGGLMGMAGGRGGRGGPGGFRGGRDVLTQVNADSTGRFEFPPLRPGTYAIEIRAEGFPIFEMAEFVVAIDSPERLIPIDPGARLYGRVVGLAAGARATLELTHADNRARRTARVDEATGEYSVEGLAAGGWVIQLVGESQRGSFRQRLGALIGAANSEAPDVFLQPAQEIRHDIDASSAMPAVVRGHVLRNGEPGAGLEVRLTLEREPSADPATADAAQMMARFGRGGGRSQRASVDSNDGSFRIDSVPPGTYRMEVWERMGRGGGPRARNDQPLYGETIDVRRGQTVSRSLQVATGKLTLALRRADQQGLGRVTVQLARLAEAGQTEPEQWRSLPSFRRVVARGGDGELGELPADTYVYDLGVNGTKGLRGTVVVAPGGAARIEGQLEAEAPKEPAVGR